MAQTARNTNQSSRLDTLLLSAIVVGMILACLVLTWMVWKAPNVLASLQQFTQTPVITQVSATSTPTDVPTATSTATSTPVSPTVSPPTATYTPEPTPTPTPSPPSPTQDLPKVPPEKTIVVDLSEQTLTAYENTRPVFSALISGGQPHTPTPIGEFAIYSKVRSQTMSGPGYSLPNVQFVAYFHSDYAIHGTYWHDNFGHRMSHGCVNMRDIDAEWLYGWAPIGTPVSVRR